LLHLLSHGEIVVQQFKETEGLIHLEKLWRQYFLDCMPQLWNVNHNGNQLEIRATEGKVEAEDLKLAGVDAVIVPKAEPRIVVTSPVVESPMTPKLASNLNSIPVTSTPATINEASTEDDVDTSSELKFRFAAGSRTSSARFDPNQTLTEDDRYFSDAASLQSFYETIRSDGSTIDDFQSFASSLSERPLHGSDGSRTSLCSGDLSVDSDTEVEDDPSAKMEM
jgi:hypothetical protein